MKVAINRCFGGFGLSDKASELCVERGMTCSEKWDDDKDFHYDKNDKHNKYYARDNYKQSFRTNPIVISVIEELGVEADGDCADLDIVDIPFSSTEGWYIKEYDGQESIHTEHRSW
jgi:hypothetical protein